MSDYITKDTGKRESFDSGAVRDVRQGKGRYDLISFLALSRIAGVYERGAAKYDDRNWEKGMPIGRTLDSALRHIGQYITGEDDEDHLAQAAWNLIAALHFDEGIKRGYYEAELDDRPIYGPHDFGNYVPEAVATYTKHAEREYGENDNRYAFDSLNEAKPMPEVQYTSDETRRSPVPMHDWSHSESEGTWHYHTEGIAGGPAYVTRPAEINSIPHIHKRPQ